ncbi:FtsX-like permease family protein, partial [Fulvivirga sp. RKSG066]|uniref:ABC transporter permease n=1 Tax=Fulvivirga aurantia TaxID=2529383 RepID=UPI0012BBB7D5
IRKALGASTSNLFLLLSNEYIRLILFSVLLAWPLAWYFLSDWLKNFAYRISLSPEIFIFSGVIIFIIAMSTVAYQTYKASVQNPAEVLKTE